MSRIGKSPIPIPEKVEIKLEGQTVRVKGPKGELSLTLPPTLSARKNEKTLEILLVKDTSKLHALHGLFRALTWNLMVGVTEGFSKRLELHGVGYRAALQGKNLDLQLGYSHPVKYTPPADVVLSVKVGAGPTYGSKQPKGLEEQVVARRKQKIRGVPDRPRLAVFRSMDQIYAQVIDDTSGHTMVSASSLTLGKSKEKKGKSGAAVDVGRTIAERAKSKGIVKVVFDRRHYRYHGRVKALADAAREGGLQF